MKQTLIGLLIGAILGFIAGYLKTEFLIGESVQPNYVYVTVVNKSEHLIKSILLKHEKGNIEIQKIVKNEKVTLIFKNGGESTYRINATLDNDSTLISNEMYVEGGYRTTETIFNDYIKSSQ